MRRYRTHAICFTAFLLLVVATGCSDPDETGGNPGLTPPTVASVAPLAGAAGACPNTLVTATFTKAMNPATIKASTFVLTGPNATAVPGQVTYNAASNTAIFTPSGTIALNTSYTATHTHYWGDGCLWKSSAAQFCMEFHHGRDRLHGNGCPSPPLTGRVPIQRLPQPLMKQ